MPIIHTNGEVFRQHRSTGIDRIRPRGEQVIKRGETVGNANTAQSFLRIIEHIPWCYTVANKNRATSVQLAKDLNGKILSPITEKNVAVFNALIKAVFDLVILSIPKQEL